MQSGPGILMTSTLSSPSVLKVPTFVPASGPDSSVSASACAACSPSANIRGCSELPSCVAVAVALALASGVSCAPAAKAKANVNKSVATTTLKRNLLRIPHPLHMLRTEVFYTRGPSLRYLEAIGKRLVLLLPSVGEWRRYAGARGRRTYLAAAVDSRLRANKGEKGRARRAPVSGKRDCPESPGVELGSLTLVSHLFCGTPVCCSSVAPSAVLRSSRPGT
jgi:hypothetical protein